MNRWLFTIKTARKELARRQLLIWELEREVEDLNQQSELLTDTIRVVSATRDEYARRLEGCHRINQDLILGSIVAYSKDKA